MMRAWGNTRQREQHAEHPARGADDFILRTEPLALSRCVSAAVSTHTKVERTRRRADPIRFQRAPEHEQREHVKKMGPGCRAKEGVADQLPGRNAGCRAATAQKQSGNELGGQLLHETPRR